MLDLMQQRIHELETEPQDLSINVHKLLAQFRKLERCVMTRSKLGANLIKNVTLPIKKQAYKDLLMYISKVLFYAHCRWLPGKIILTLLTLAF